MVIAGANRRALGICLLSRKRRSRFGGPTWSGRRV